MERVIEILPTEEKVKRVVLDFETTTWKSGGVKLKGCAFHWSQAAFRKIQFFGLVRDCQEDHAVHVFLKKLMALPYLPSEYIFPVFNSLRNENIDPVIEELMTYVRSTWIESTNWKPSAWSVFGSRSVRKNNDIDGWHH